MTWELRQNLIVGVVRQRPAESNNVFAHGIEMEIQFSNDGPIVTVARSIETKPAKIQATVLAIGRIVSRRVFVHESHHAGQGHARSGG